MGLAHLHSRALLGLQAPSVTVEVHLANGLPSFSLVGLADVEVREAKERVRSAIANSGLEFPSNKRITVNLAPADLPKDSGRFDLPIALGILAASGQIEWSALAAFAFAGELSLSGALRGIRGALPMVLASQDAATAAQTTPLGSAQEPAALYWVLPPGSAQEAALVPGSVVYEAKHLLDVVQYFKQAMLAAANVGTAEIPADVPTGWSRLDTAALHSALPQPRYADMADVKGQSAARRALEIAAAGGHHLLMVGSPGAGKSMLAQRMAGLLPPMALHDALQSAAVASLGGQFDWHSWSTRPVRSPHHTASAVALVGGASPPRPGEISLAHQGILFLDELPEFPRAALEALREPLETGVIHIARAGRSAQFPAQFQLIAAMNPCPCGYWGSAMRSCRCSPDQVARYQARLSGPLLDRIDLHVEVQAMPAAQLLNAPEGEGSATMQARVTRARHIAVERQGFANHALHGRALEQFAALQPDVQRLLQAAAGSMGLSARAMHKIIRVARTIADLEQGESAGGPIAASHVAEAIQYRRALLGQQH